MADVTVVGAERVQSTLHDAAKRCADMESINAQVAANVAANVRAPRRTGRLAGSIRPAATNTEAMVTSDLIYAGVIENGWPGHNIAAQNFVRDAFDRTETQTMAAYEKWGLDVLGEVKGA